MRRLLSIISRGATLLGLAAVFFAIAFGSVGMLAASLAVFGIGWIADEIIEGFTTVADRPYTEE